MTTQPQDTKEIVRVLKRLRLGLHKLNLATKEEITGCNTFTDHSLAFEGILIAYGCIEALRSRKNFQAFMRNMDELMSLFMENETLGAFQPEYWDEWKEKWDKLLKKITRWKNGRCQELKIPLELS